MTRQRISAFPIRPRRIVSFGLSLLTMLGAVSAAHAQQMPMTYGGGSYPQGYPQQQMPMMAPQYGYYPQPGYQQPMPRQQMPNTYAGFYPNAGNSNNYPAQPYYPAGGYPAQNYQRPAYTPTYYSNANANAAPPVNYYYMQNPMEPLVEAPAKAPVAAKKTNWASIFASGSADTPPVDPSFDPGLDPSVDPRRPILPYHRPTHECMWVKADYVGTYITPMRMAAPLVTTGSVLDPAPGALGQPSTLVLYGNNNVNYGLFSGMRLQAGVFLDSNDRFSLDVIGFWAMPNSQNYAIAGDGNGIPVISRPITNVAGNRQGAFVNSLPATITGSINIQNKTDFGGVEFNARYHTYFNENLHLDGLLGFRYLRLSERLSINERISPLVDNFLTFQNMPVNAPNALADMDSFQTLNQFFGPQIGARLGWEYRWFSLDTFAKLGIGATTERTTVNGTTTFITPTGNQVASGGILALPSNIGVHSRTVFGLVPEMGFNLGVEVTQCFRINLGYSLMMWNHVVRPGSQYSTDVNPGQVVGSPTFGALTGPVAPSYRFNDEFFWAHSFNIGLEFHY